MFGYIPKKSKEIYKEIIAHRGLHNLHPENTISAYTEAIKKGYAIELDIRITKDSKLVCMHDRYTKRLLGITGKTSDKTYMELKQRVVQKSNQWIPLLSEVLQLVDGKITLLIEVKGMLNRKFEELLLKEIDKYNGKVYFHAKNFVSYIRLKKIWGDKVFWVLNIFRKRFHFIKANSYKRLNTKNV